MAATATVLTTAYSLILKKGRTDRTAKVSNRKATSIRKLLGAAARVDHTQPAKVVQRLSFPLITSFIVNLHNLGMKTAKNSQGRAREN